MASTMFKEFAGSKIKSMPFCHSADDTNEADMLYIDVTDFTIGKLEECVDELLELYTRSSI